MISSKKKFCKIQSVSFLEISNVSPFWFPVYSTRAHWSAQAWAAEARAGSQEKRGTHLL